MRQPSTRPWHRYSTAERAAWIARYRSSGLTQRRFAQQHGLALSTLQQWLYRQQHQSSPKIPVTAFHEIPIAPLVPAISTAWAMEVVTSKGVTLRLREALSARELARLLRI
jgi:transposase-like protein